MSSILKALEKVDESQRSTRRPAGTGGLPKGRGRRPAWLIPAWALGGAAVATLATYAVMGGFSKPATVADPAKPLPVVSAAPATTQVQPVQKEVEAPAQSVAASAVKPTVAAKPAAKPAAEPAAKVAAKPAPGPATNKVAKPVTQSAAKATSNVVAAPQTSAKAAAKQLAHPTAKAVVLPAAAAQPAPVHQAPVQPAPVAVAPAPAAAQPAQQKSRPEIRVSGIAWQSNSESSFAMVNGRPMRQGSVVEGYKIEQIYEDSVRFSSSKGNSLVVPLGAGEE